MGTPQTDTLISWPDPSFSTKNLKSPIVTLRVGRERTVLTAHKAILIKSDYFAKCLEEGRFEEGSKNEIQFPDDDPDDMVAVLRYLYTGNVFRAETNDFHFANCNGWGPSLTIESAFPQFMRTYIVADKYCIEDVCQRVINLVEGMHWSNTIRWHHLEGLKAAELKGSALWKLFIRQIAGNLGQQHGHIDLKTMMEAGLEDDEDTKTEILQQLAMRLCDFDERVRRSGNDGWGN